MLFSNRLLRMLSILVILSLTEVSAQTDADTLKIVVLHEVEISAKQISDFHSSSPLQTIKQEDLLRTGALSVSDIARRFAGVQVKDYGGVGGLKTISLRSLGASYTGVSYDGIPVTDGNTGQIDLGRFALDNLESISLNTGESDNIFLPAKIQASAGVLNINTRRPSSFETTNNRFSAAVRGGSFGLINPSVMVETKLSQSTAMNFSTDYLHSEGNYPYEQTIGYGSSSIIEKKRRNNSAVTNMKSELNLFANTGNGGTLSAKIFGFTTARQLPVAVYYNDYSESHLKDGNFFTSSTFRKKLSETTDFQTNAKITFSRSFFVAEQAKEYLFLQREYYVNSVLLHNFGQKFAVSWANDATYASVNTKGNNIEGSPSRIEWLSAPAAQFQCRMLNITAKILATLTSVDYPSRINKDASNRINVSPYIGIAFNKLNTNKLTARAFYKKTYRQPSLSDIFYATFGNRNLKPETADQFNFGSSLLTNLSNPLPYFLLSLDAYCYNVKDKIIAYPTNNMYIWTMINLGKVEIRGIDAKLELHSTALSGFLIETGGTFTIQSVLDKTDPRKESYNKRPVYTPKYSGSGWAFLKTPLFDINYTLNYIGKRYFEPYNPPTAQMAPVVEQTVILARSFRINSYKINLAVECINIADTQYEIVRSYPMEGRSFRVKLTINN